jgi:hypothetical protein
MLYGMNAFSGLSMAGVDKLKPMGAAGSQPFKTQDKKPKTSAEIESEIKSASQELFDFNSSSGIGGAFQALFNGLRIR